MLGQVETQEPGLAAKNLGEVQDVQELAVPGDEQVLQLVLQD